MIISHKHKFIFIKVPKSAGTSIEAFFIPLLGDTDVNTSAQDGENVYYRSRNIDIPKEWIGTRKCRELEHFRVSDMQEVLPKSLWEDYTIFGVMRNPWDRLVSLYCYLQQYMSPHAKSAVAKGFEQFVHYIRLIAEEKWCVDKSALPQPDRPLMSGGRIWPRACRPAVQFFCDNSGNVIATDIVRYENLNEDLERVCGKLGIVWPGQLEPRLRSQTRQRESYYDMYNEYTKEVVRVLYAADIEYMNYRF